MDGCGVNMQGLPPSKIGGSWVMVRFGSQNFQRMLEVVERNAWQGSCGLVPSTQLYTDGWYNGLKTWTVYDLYPVLSSIVRKKRSSFFSHDQNRKTNKTTDALTQMCYYRKIMNTKGVWCGSAWSSCTAPLIILYFISASWRVLFLLFHSNTLTLTMFFRVKSGVLSIYSYF